MNNTPPHKPEGMTDFEYRQHLRRLTMANAYGADKPGRVPIRWKPKKRKKAK